MSVCKGVGERRAMLNVLNQQMKEILGRDIMIMPSSELATIHT